MLERLQIDSFKAFAKADIKFEPFTLLVGPNGSGKTTVLQAIDLLGSLARTTITEHLHAHGWDYSDLPYLRSRNSQFGVTAELRFGKLRVEWSLRLESRRRPGIASEKITDLNTQIVYMERTRRHMSRLDEHTGTTEEIAQTLTSSWISAIDEVKDVVRFPALVKIAKWARAIRGYFFLDPIRLRSPSRGNNEVVGSYGDQLASFLGRLQKKNPPGFQRLITRVRKHYPALKKLDPKTGRYGWTKLEVTEKFGPHDAKFSAAQVSDGLLRLIAIAAMHEHGGGSQLLLIDEIENGMHPGLLGGVMEMLQDLSGSKENATQIVATSHSPIAVNFCKRPASVQIVMRSSDGTAIATPLADTKNFGRLRQHFDLGELWYNVGEQRLLPYV